MIQQNQGTSQNHPAKLQITLHNFVSNNDQPWGFDNGVIQISPILIPLWVQI